MSESTLPRFLSHVEAQKLTSLLRAAIGGVRAELVALGLDQRAVDHELGLAIARIGASYGLDLLPTMAAKTIERLEVAVGHLSGQLERVKIPGVNGHAHAAANENGALPPFAPVPVESRLHGAWGPSVLRSQAHTMISGLRIEGAGSLTEIALTELAKLVDSRHVDVFLDDAKRYLAGLGFTIRVISRAEHSRIVRFLVGVG